MASLTVLTVLQGYSRAYLSKLSHWQDLTLTCGSLLVRAPQLHILKTASTYPFLHLKLLVVVIKHDYTVHNNLLL